MLKMFKILFIFLLKASTDVKAQFRNYTDQCKLNYLFRFNYFYIN